MTLCDDSVDWAAAYQASLRYQKAAAFAAMGLGATVSLVGLLAGALILGLSQDAVTAGLAGLGSVIVGLVISRRGRKALMGDPWIIEGTLTQKAQQPTRKGKGRQVLVVDVRRARRLSPEGRLSPVEDRQGPRTVPARPAAFEAAAPGEVALLCLPSGEAIALLSSFHLIAPGG